MSRNRNQKPSIDPVILIALGVVFLTIAILMIVFPSKAYDVNIANNSGAMSQLAVAFITGLTTGGLSCLAVQGGLLASSLAHQIEQDYVAQIPQQKKRRGKKPQPAARANAAFPILLFLVAKIVAYTLLGALLGLLGSYLTLSPTTRAVLMILIGVFM